MRNALFRYGVAFDNNVPNLVTLDDEPAPNSYYRTFLFYLLNHPILPLGTPYVYREVVLLNECLKNAWYAIKYIVVLLTGLRLLAAGRWGLTTSFLAAGFITDRFLTAGF